MRWHSWPLTAPRDRRLCPNRSVVPHIHPSDKEKTLIADWRALAADLVVSDGVINTAEVELVRKHLLGDGKITKSEFEFLIELRKRAKKAVKDFKVLFFDAIKTIILHDGRISAEETAWLEKIILADLKVDDEEKALLTALKNEAKSVGPEFEALYKKCMG